MGGGAYSVPGAAGFAIERLPAMGVDLSDQAAGFAADCELPRVGTGDANVGSATRRSDVPAERGYDLTPITFEGQKGDEYGRKSSGCAMGDARKRGGKTLLW